MQRSTENHKAITKTEKKAQVGPSLFTLLPPDLTLLVTSLLPCSETRRLASTFPSIFTHARLEPVSRRAEYAVQAFFIDVMNANVEAAKAMLAKDPGLILEAYAIGEHECVPALLLAKRMRDIPMCKMLLEHLQTYDAHCSERLNRKVNHTSAQIKYIAANSYKKAPLDVNIFNVVADAIAAHPVAVTAELTRQRTGVETKLSDQMDAFRSAINQHGQCSAEDMANVFDAIVRNAKKFTTDKQFHIFFLQVVVHVVGKLPLYLRKDLNDGILDMLRKYKMVDRARLLKCNVLSTPFVEFAQNSGLSYDFVSELYELAQGNMPLWAAVRDGFQKFSQGTESALVGLQLMQPGSEAQPEPEKAKRPGCTIC